MTSASKAVKRLQSESLQQKSLNQLKQDAAELGLSKEDVKQFGNLTHKQTWLAAVENAVATKGNAIAQSQERKLDYIGIDETERYRIDKFFTKGFKIFCKTTERYIKFDIPGEPDNDLIFATLADAKAWTERQDNAVQRYEEQPFEPAQVLIDGEWVEKAVIVDPSQLPTLKETDERFEAWESWMIPGAVFSTGRARYSLLYFDKWGNCHCKALEDGQWHNFRIETIINCLIPPSSPVEPFTPASELPPKLTELTEPVDVKENLLRRMASHGTPPEEIEQLRQEPLDFCTAYLGEFLLTLADSFQELTT